MERKKFAIRSDFDGLTLRGVIFEPSDNVKGVVQIQHGMGEYKERYQELMEVLSKDGFVAVCYDQRGHGDSVQSEADYGWFRDLNGEAVVDDAVQVTKYLKGLYPHLPFSLIGHSMGTMVARCYIQKNDTLIDKLVLSGSPSKNPLIDAGILLSKLVRIVKGDRHRSKMLSFVSTGKGDKLFPGEGAGAWLSRNYECTKAFYENPKGKHKFTTNGFENLFKLMKHTYQKKRYKVKNPKLPILFMSGEKDAVRLNPIKWSRSLNFLYDVGYKNVTGKLYKNMRHEVFNEIGREEVFEELLRFLNT